MPIIHHAASRHPVAPRADRIHKANIQRVIKWTKPTLLVLAGTLALAIQTAAAADATNSDIGALRSEIEQLKQGQRVIEAQLQEIKRLLSANPANSAAGQRPNPAIGATVSIAGKPFMGDTNARLTLIEFADYECPYCGRHTRDTALQIKKNYVETGKLKYAFSDLPLPMHSHAKQAAEAALCAGEQGKYWEMHDLLFAHQGALEHSNLIAYATALGLDVAAFEKSLDSGKYASQVQSSAADAGKIGLSGAPSFVLGLTRPNDPTIKVLQVIVGAQSYDAFQKAIEDALNPAQPVVAQSPGIGATVNVDGKPFKGNKDAKLTLIEFSDYECSFCAKEAIETFPQLEKDYVSTGKLKYVYSDLVLDMHPHALKAAEASWCAAEQGRFWEMHDLLFASQQELEETNLISYATALGLDPGAFQQCLDANQFAVQVRKSSTEARQIGFKNTPMCAIGLTQPNSSEVKVLKVIVGANGYPELKAAIDSLLNPAPARALPEPAVGATVSIIGRPFKGDDQARVTLVEFADYQCPSCGHYTQNTEPQLLKDYVNTGKLKYVYGDLPLPMHPQAAKAAEAALCAGEQGKYWEMHDLLFANQHALQPAYFPGYVKTAGLDPAAFQQCLDSRKFSAQVYKSFADAERTGFIGTPSFALGLTQPNDPTIKILKVIVGAQKYEVFQEAIESVLKSTHPNPDTPGKSI
ncbi:MAG: thioredoxin domain-containing protein [Verrucomicrobiia bacterium]